MPISARQTSNLNPNEEPSMATGGGSQTLVSGSPGFIGGGTTQTEAYAPRSGEATRSGMFTNLQDYLKANEGAAAPIVSQFESKASGLEKPATTAAETAKTKLSTLKSGLETAKSGLESKLGEQTALKSILETARKSPGTLTSEQISKYRTGVGAYKTPDVQSSISGFIPQKTQAEAAQTEALTVAERARAGLQPMGEISGVRNLIRELNPEQRVTAGGASLDAFITRQAPEYQKFTEGLGTKIQNVGGIAGQLSPYSKAIQDYLGSGTGSLSNIGSQFDPNLASGGAFQSAAESLKAQSEYAPTKEQIITAGLSRAGFDQPGIQAQREAASREKSNQFTQQDQNRINAIDKRISYLSEAGRPWDEGPGGAGINQFQDEIDALTNERNALNNKTRSTAEQGKLSKMESDYANAIANLSRSDFMNQEQQSRYRALAGLSGLTNQQILNYLGGLGLSSSNYSI